MTRQANAGRACLAASLEEAHLFRARDDFTNQFGHLAFNRVGMAENDARIHLLPNGRIHRWIRVAKGHWSERVSKIDKFAAISVPYSAPLSTDNDSRLFRHQPRCLGASA